jgi:hypothetical protein
MAIQQRYFDSFVCTVRAYGDAVLHIFHASHGIDASNSWASTAGTPAQGRKQKQQSLQ